MISIELIKNNIGNGTASRETESFIAEALKPAHVYGLAMDYERKCVTAVVPNEEFFAAIGKKGQNARLASRLTHYKIDIKN